ncbi:MAG: chemotaxis protein CheW [bacterium]|nr:chemotaxis protein CheW [bacterium]
MNPFEETREVSSSGWLRFEIDEARFALPLESIAEVSRASRPRLIPRVPLEVGGVLNFRGEPLPAIDGGVLLLGRPAAKHHHLLVMQQDGLRIGVLVGHVAKIERSLRSLRAADGIPDPELELDFVEQVGNGSEALGLVQPESLVERAKELLQEQRSEGESNSCHNVF